MLWAGDSIGGLQGGRWKRASDYRPRGMHAVTPCQHRVESSMGTWQTGGNVDAGVFAIGRNPRAEQSCSKGQSVPSDLTFKL